jgi:hypothetical protein
MLKTKLFFALLVISIILSACGRSTPEQLPLPSPKPLPTQQQASGLTGIWAVDMQLSGGIAGLSRSIEINSSGAVVAKDDRTGKTAKRQLTSDELAQFKALVNSASLKPASGTPTGCADCFIYSIKITSSSGDFSAQFDDVDLPDSGMSPVVKYLMGLVNSMLANG